jgi:hypothetical protein
MEALGADAESIKENAGFIFKWSVITLLGIGTAYIVIKDPRVIGRWLRLPVDIAMGTVNTAGTAVKIGADAIMLIPNAISNMQQ